MAEADVTREPLSSDADAGRNGMAICRNCGAEAAQPLLRTRDYNRRVSDRWFTYLRCTRCEHLLLDHVPDTLADSYPPSYYSIPADRAALLAASSHEIHKIHLLQQYLRSGTLLDVGAGCGGFAAVAQEAGFEVDAIELSRDCCDFIESELGIRAYCSARPESTLETLGSYDAIALWHVLEHLPDPWSLLEAAAAKLNPGYRPSSAGALLPG